MEYWNTGMMGKKDDLFVLVLIFVLILVIRHFPST